MYTDVYTFIELLRIQMFTHLLCFYIYRCLHMYCIAMYVDVYMFILLLCKYMFIHLLNYYVYRCLHI